MSKIGKEIETIWDEVLGKASENSIQIAWDKDFLKLLKEQETQAEEEAANRLEPWVSIFNEGIQWLSQLHISLANTLNECEQISEQIKATWALTGAACAHSVAIRRLVLSGLDSSAKIILRTLTEILNVCMAIINDPLLASEFCSVQDFKKAKEFWHRELSPKKQRELLESIELSFLGLGESDTNDLREWRKEESTVSSQFVHPTYLGAAICASPPSIEGHLYQKSGILGTPSCFSIRTLSYACKSIWYFCQIGIGMMGKNAKENRGGARRKWSSRSYW